MDRDKVRALAKQEPMHPLCKQLAEHLLEALYLLDRYESVVTELQRAIVENGVAV